MVYQKTHRTKTPFFLEIEINFLENFVYVLNRLSPV